MWLLGSITGVLYPAPIPGKPTTYASGEFAPAYFTTAHGNKNLTVIFHLPPGVQPPESHLLSRTRAAGLAMPTPRRLLMHRTGSPIPGLVPPPMVPPSIPLALPSRSSMSRQVRSLWRPPPFDIGGFISGISEQL